MFTVFAAQQPLVIPVAYAVLRERARIRKDDLGEPWPWSSDLVLAGPRSFTNVRREFDKTTKWAATYLRDNPTAIVDAPNRPAALVLYRLLNRLEMGPVLFGRTDDAASSRTIIVKSLTIGDRTVHDVRFGLEGDGTEPLLGFGALSAFGKFSIDAEHGVLTFG
jgi:hypothetical protein